MKKGREKKQQKGQVLQSAVPVNKDRRHHRPQEKSRLRGKGKSGEKKNVLGTRRWNINDQIGECGVERAGKEAAKKKTGKQKKTKGGGAPKALISKRKKKTSVKSEGDASGNQVNKKDNGGNPQRPKRGTKEKKGKRSQDKYTRGTDPGKWMGEKQASHRNKN